MVCVKQKPVVLSLLDKEFVWFVSNLNGVSGVSNLNVRVVCQT